MNSGNGATDQSPISEVLKAVMGIGAYDGFLGQGKENITRKKSRTQPFGVNEL
jgi:hypothetical protein